METRNNAFARLPNQLEHTQHRQEHFPHIASYYVTPVVTCMGFHPSLSLKYSPLWSFLNTIALTKCTRSISSSLLTTKIYTHPHVHAADGEAREPKGFSIESYIQYGFITVGSYCGDFIKWAPVCVASKGSIVSDLGVTFAVTWWTGETHFPLFPN